MKKLLALTLSMTTAMIFAQLPQSLTFPINKVNLFDNYEGSIYENSNFVDASIIDEKSSTFEANLRFNIHTDAIEYAKDNDWYEIQKKKTIHARIGDHYYYYCDFKSPRGIRQEGYYILIELNENYGIYKKLDLTITESAERTSLFDPVISGRIDQTEMYYLEQKGIIVELPESKKGLLAVFNDKASELDKYMKKEKIRLRKEEDLIRLVSKYNALINADNSPLRSLLSNHQR